MTSETVLQQIENMVIGLLAAEPSHFLVGIKIKPTNNIKVFIDGDNGLPIEKCVRYNRSLYKLIEEAGFYPEGDFSLEVSSPGIGEPLKMLRQYAKNKGRFVEVVFLDDTKKEGQLIEVTENDILIEQTTGKGKKLETAQFLIPFDNIKSTTVQIKF
jgi:ribosome maturation factor RimP